MNFVRLSADDGIATVVLNRPKVNALNESVIEELGKCFQELASDSAIKSVILTGEGSFFSFGFDIPEFLSYPKDSFRNFLVNFTDLLSCVFLFPKPVMAALNGHAVAGGCLLAAACDYRLMVSGKAKIALNELTFGATFFASGVQILKFLIGGRNAESVLYSGAMYSAEEARDLGLVHEVASKENFNESARKIARSFAAKDGRAFQSMKMLLRKQTAEEIKKTETDSIAEFVDIWYSENTRSNLEKIKIRD